MKASLSGNIVEIGSAHCDSSDNYSPRQHDEKLIPTTIRHALAKQPILQQQLEAFILSSRA